MEPSRKPKAKPKPVVPERAQVIRFQIPPVLLKSFAQQPQVRLDISTAGLWPIPPDFLRKLLEDGSLQEMVKDKQFTEHFEIVIMAK